MKIKHTHLLAGLVIGAGLLLSGTAQAGGHYRSERHSDLRLAVDIVGTLLYAASPKTIVVAEPAPTVVVSTYSTPTVVVTEPVYRPSTVVISSGAYFPAPVVYHSSYSSVRYSPAPVIRRPSFHRDYDRGPSYRDHGPSYRDHGPSRNHGVSVRQGGHHR